MLQRNVTILMSLITILVSTNVMMEAQGQGVNATDTAQRLWLCMSNTPPKFEQTYKAAGIPNIPYFSMQDIDPDKSGNLNKASFSKSIQKAFPDKNYSGLIILDWEGEDFDVLKFKPINNNTYNNSLKKYLDLVKYTRQLRPKAQIGIYDIPMAIYFVKVDTTWRRRNSLIESLINACDVLMPSLYDIYPTGAVSWQDDTTYITEVLKLTLEKAAKFNKAVIPFVWHRYSDAIQESGLYAIEPEEFYRQIKLMSEISYNGRRINGVIWWQEDLYFMNIKAPNIVREMGKEDPLTYREGVLLRYWDLLRRVYR